MVRERLAKLDDVELERRVKLTKKHPLLKKYLKEVIGDTSHVFGSDDDFEELVCFENWCLDRQEQNTSPPSPAVVAKASPASRPALPKASPTQPPAVVNQNNNGSGALDIRVTGNVLWFVIGSFMTGFVFYTISTPKAFLQTNWEPHNKHCSHHASKKIPNMYLIDYN